ncbi:hypothetical protein [Leptolyngbya sp. Heron Island J]|uniref:hypothetical protein n=1 Tax=Leptolyngbya sp. Heron Island J TaxID=1385935 RepID=UPI0012688157|nr:hypothetical protein [Leptolyngbya sp. Heron Island J]
MVNRIWKQALYILIWLSVSCAAAASHIYGFMVSFDCDDGMRTGAICTYAYGAFLLGGVTFIGLILFGSFQVLSWLRQRL